MTDPDAARAAGTDPDAPGPTPWPGSHPHPDGQPEGSQSCSDRVTVWFGGHPPRTRRERARSRAIRRGVLGAGLLIVVGSMVQLPLIIVSPGPTYNVLGEVEGTPLISISGTTTYPTSGELDMTTIAERGGSSGGVYLGEALLGWAATDQAVFPREAIYGPETSGEEVAERNDQLFALSQSDSVAAALGELGIPTEQQVVVTVVSGGSPADGELEAGDEIVAVDGQAVATPADVGSYVRAREVGDAVEIEVLRPADPDADPTPVTLTLQTEANPRTDDPDAAPSPYVGIVVGTAYEAPFDIEFGDSNVGGPSAGMMFSLGIIDMLTEGQLNGGAHVAGTGTIDPEGAVGPIGGIQQKLIGASEAGAELFVAPRSNCEDVVGHVPDGLTVAAVDTLSAARTVVRTWTDDPTSPLPQCGDAETASPS